MSLSSSYRPRVTDWTRLITLEERRYIREKIKSAYQMKASSYEELLELTCAIEEEFVFASAPSRLDYFKSGTCLIIGLFLCIIFKINNWHFNGSYLTVLHFFLMEGVQYEKRVAEKDNQMRLYLSSTLKPIGISHPAPVEELEEITDIVHKKPKVEHCK